MARKKVRIMLIPLTELPIPSVGGGGVETLITNLLDVNEKQRKVKIIVISKYDEEASKKKYEHSKIYYFKQEIITEKLNTFRLLWRLYILWRKMFQNRIAKKIIKKDYGEMDFFVFQCYRIAKHEHITHVINEGRDDEIRWNAFNNIVGEDNFYNHIHYNRECDINAHKVIHNSISISNYVKKDWVADLTTKGKNYVLYNGIDTDKFSYTMESMERMELRQNLGFSENDIVVIFCGRLIEVKGVRELLDAFDMLMGHSIKLMLIGSVFYAKECRTNFSEEIVKRANSMPNVNYLGYIKNEDMPKYYAMADIMVIPSIWQEGAGLVAVEGMAAGLPLIITKSGGMIEYVNNETSIQVPISDRLSEDLATQILQLSKDYDRRQSMALAGRNRALLFTKEKYYDDFINIVCGKKELL